jgi:hydroxypyruvate isomerase
MPRFAANLTLLYQEHTFLDRFAAAAQDGFNGVEYLFPYAFSAQELQQRLQDYGLQQVLFNAPPGDWDAGERGLACLPGREAEFREGFAKALGYAAALGCPRVHVMAGIAPPAAAPDEAIVRAADAVASAAASNCAIARASSSVTGRPAAAAPVETTIKHNDNHQFAFMRSTFVLACGSRAACLTPDAPQPHSVRAPPRQHRRSPEFG